MSNIIFRIAGTADTPAIVALINTAYRGESSRVGWTTEADLIDGVRTHDAEIIELIETAGSMILLCLDGDTVVGTVHLQRVSENHVGAAFLSMFAVNPYLQAKGIGKQLMAAAESAVVCEWGVAKMLMDVITVRTELIVFYQRRGYQLTGKLKPFPVSPELWTPKVDGLQLARLEKSLI